MREFSDAGEGRPTMGTRAENYEGRVAGIEAKSAKNRVPSLGKLAIVSALQKWRVLHAARKEY